MLQVAPVHVRDFRAARNMLRVSRPWQRAFWGGVIVARAAQRRGAMQKFRELAPLVALLLRRSPRAVLEIGTARGGTFYAWCRAAASDAVIASIDLPEGPYGGGYSIEDLPALRSHGQPAQELHFLRGDSHDVETHALLVEALRGRELEFLMIDGDHTYDGVRSDFEMYSPLVGSGCPIAFHDIVPHPDDRACEVDRFWAEIKGDYEHLELIDAYVDPAGEQYGGIGVVIQR